LLFIVSMKQKEDIKPSVNNFNNEIISFL
jgi:hypothetical protein